MFANVLPQDLLKYGLIPEFAGRIPVIVALEELGKEALLRVLLEPKNSVIKQYQKLMKLDDVDLEFEPEALDEIVAKAQERNTGARGLRSIVENALMDVMYETPSDDSIEKVVITKDAINGTTPPKVIKSA